MIARILYLIGGIILVLIGLRFVLRLLGANPDNTFVNFIYGLSTPFVAPFAGVLGQDAAISGVGTATTSVVDWAAVIAFIVIGIIVAFIGSLFARRTV